MSASNEESRFNRGWLENVLGASPRPTAPSAAGLEITEHLPALRDHEVSAVVTELRRIALEYGGSQQLRERLAHYIVPILKGEQRP